MTAVAERSNKSDVCLSKLAAQMSPKLAAIVGNRRLSVSDRMAAAERAETMAVALAQPHRRGSDCREAGLPLAQFIAASGLRNEAALAGRRYAEVVRCARRAMGLYVPGLDLEPKPAEPLDLEQQAAVDRGAKMALLAADNVLRIETRAERAPRRMVRLCCDELPWDPADERILWEGLRALMYHFGLLDEGINRGRNE